MADEAQEKKFNWDKFIKVQQNLPNVTKAGQGNYGSYMKLEDLNPALLKVLNENGFAWVTMPCITQTGKPGLRYSIIDKESGVSIGDTMELSVASGTPQAQGSAITYARRYSLTAMTGLVSDMDDDGSEGSKDPSDGSKSLEELSSTVDKLGNSKEELRKWYAGLKPSEKTLALPLVQAKIAETEAA